MYAYATLEAEWRDVLTVPASAVMTEGDVNIGYKTYCYMIEQGHAKRIQIETGAKNDQIIQVLKKQVAAINPGDKARWETFTGAEELIYGDLSGLKDEQAVDVSHKP
jgi:hypothetical protein